MVLDDMNVVPSIVNVNAPLATGIPHGPADLLLQKKKDNFPTFILPFSSKSLKLLLNEREVLD